MSEQENRRSRRGLQRTLKRTVRRAALRVVRYVLLAGRFAELYWPYLLAVLAGAALSWLLADAASDYTKGGWEFHIEQRAWGLDLHVHHWYYGLPLLVLALVLLDDRPVFAVFLFVFGQALSAHSYQNENGIPSILEGGATLAVPAYVYWPVASLLAALFTFFVVRTHEWLAMRSSSEEATVCYRASREACDAAFEALTAWGRTEFDRETVDATREGARSASFSRLESRLRGIWELHCASRPVGDGTVLLTVRVRHMAPKTRTGDMLAYLERAHEVASPHAPRIFNEVPATVSSE